MKCAAVHHAMHILIYFHFNEATGVIYIKMALFGKDKLACINTGNSCMQIV